MWKPGNLVTIKGIVYRVKRGYGDICKECAFNIGYCSWPNRGRYPVPDDCYFKEIKPKS